MQNIEQWPSDLLNDLLILHNLPVNLYCHNKVTLYLLLKHLSQLTSVRGMSKSTFSSSMKRIQARLLPYHPTSNSTIF